MVIVYGITGRLEPRRSGLSAAIQQCLSEVLGLPEGKSARRFVPLARENFDYPAGRSDAYTAIEIHLMQGREPATLRRLIHLLFEVIDRDVGIAPMDLEITLHEQPPHCWGFRGMTGDEAQLDYSLRV